MTFDVETVQQYAPGALADLLNRMTEERFNIVTEAEQLLAEAKRWEVRVDETKAALSAAEVARDAFATEIMDYKLELNSLREEVERLEAERKNGVWFYSRRWAESERTQLLQELAEARAERDGFFNSVRIAANIGTQDRSILIQAVGALRNDLVDTRAELKEQLAEMERMMTRDLEWQAVFPGCCHPADLAGAVAELRAEVERMEAAKCPCFWCNEGQEPKQPRNAATEARLATLEADLDNARKTVGKLNCDYYDALLEVSSLKAALSAAEAERDAFATEARLASERREADDFEWHNEGCPCPCCQSNLPAPANPNRAKLQAVYDALAEHCQTAKHPSPLLLEQLQSLYRLLEDPA